MQIRALTRQDRPWVLELLEERWGGASMVGHGEVFFPAEHRGFVAEDAGRRQGIATYRVDGGSCELTLIDALEPGGGVGSALLDAVTGAARDAGCRRLWLVTTNDNLHALGWYERRGFSVVGVREGAIDEARTRKPTIPLVNEENGLPVRDEIEMARLL
jgi:N-acetylglutamate synthase-like GNAT family acetyltransferase